MSILKNNKKFKIYFLVCSVFLIFGFLLFKNSNNREVAYEDIQRVVGIILSREESVVLEDKDEKQYIFDKNEIKESVGTEVQVDYKKVDTDKNSVSDNKVIDYEVVSESRIPDSWLDDGIFSDYYVRAYQKLETLSLDEKIGQTLLARFPEENQITEMDKYHLGGFVFFEIDFKGKSRDSVISMITSVQEKSKIPLITAVDEEGGRVSRISSNKELVGSPFRSPQDIYSEGGFDAIRSDVKNKSGILKGLGLNLNLAPVVDVSTDSKNYIFDRTLGLGTKEVCEYAKVVIDASKGTGVSYTLKHFPGYGSNLDTHLGASIDKKKLADILSEDVPPFKSGIESGAEAIMVSHNIVEAIDPSNEASLSPKVHDLLLEDLGFTGVVITDDISMGALKTSEDSAKRAILAGNDLLITTDYAKSFNEIKSAILNSSIKEETLDHSVFKILAWKYYKGLLK